MAVVRITHSINGFSAIDYALSGKPHHADRFISGRVLASSGVNCTVHGCRSQMNSVWCANGINDPLNRPKIWKRRQVQRLIQSFDPKQLSYKRTEDVKRANEIGKATAKLLYPNHQSIVVTQADGIHHVLHNHIITNMLDFQTGKSMTGKDTDWHHVREVSDDIIHDQFHLDPTANKQMIQTANGRIPMANQHVTDAEYHIKKRGKYSWVEDIRNRVSYALGHATDWHSFRANLRSSGVAVNLYRTHMVNKHRVIRRDKDGSPLFKKHATYSFTGKDGKIHKIRDRRLGTDYSHAAMVSDFDDNLFDQEQKQAEKADKEQIKQDNQFSEVTVPQSKSFTQASSHALVVSSAASISTSKSKSMPVSKSNSNSFSHSANRLNRLRSARSYISHYDSQLATIRDDPDTVSMYKEAYGSNYASAKSVIDPMPVSSFTSISYKSATPSQVNDFLGVNQLSSESESSIDDDTDWTRLDRQDSSASAYWNHFVKSAMDKQFIQDEKDRKKRKHNERIRINQETKDFDRQAKRYNQQAADYDRSSELFSGIASAFKQAIREIKHGLYLAKSALSTGAKTLRRFFEKRKEELARQRQRDIQSGKDDPQV